MTGCITRLSLLSIDPEPEGALEPGVPVPVLAPWLELSNAPAGVPLPGGNGVVVGLGVPPDFGEEPALVLSPLPAPWPKVVWLDGFGPMASDPWGLEGDVAMTVAAVAAATTEAATEATATRRRRGVAGERRVWRRV